MRKKTWFEILFSLKGRLPRRPFWYQGMLYPGVTAMVFAYFSIALAAPWMPLNEPGSIAVSIYWIVVTLVIVALVWIHIATHVKRLHDMNIHGLLVLLAFIPFVGYLFTLAIGCAPGTKGDNRYGSDDQYLY